MIDREIIFEKVSNMIEEIAIILMRHEHKDFCLAKITHHDWSLISYKDESSNCDRFFVIVPSQMFKRLILGREYLNIVEEYPQSFGTGNDWDVLKAIIEHDRRFLLRDYSEEEYLSYLSGETMAYVFEVFEDNLVSDRILRLDLCRGINPRTKEFRGGILHALKHFSLDDNHTISSNGPEFALEYWSEIRHIIIMNFFSDCFQKEKTNYYEAFSTYKDGHELRGVYYKEENVPVFFLDSIRVNGHK